MQQTTFPETIANNTSTLRDNYKIYTGLVLQMFNEPDVLHKMPLENTGLSVERHYLLVHQN